MNGVCARAFLRRTGDGPQSTQWWSLSHELQWIPKDKLHENGGHWAECVHSAAAGISSIGATYIPNVYLCFYTTSCECCVQTFLLRLIFIGVEPRERRKKKRFFLGSTCLRARARSRWTNILTHAVMMMVFRLNYLLDGRMSIFLLRATKTKRNQRERE